MTPDDELFADALDLPRVERTAFLDRACADAGQRARLNALLRGYDKAQIVLRSPHGPRPIALAPEAGTTIGRYKLLEKIGEGGCGVVWMAEQEEPVRRRVALKVIKLGMDTRDVIARFEAERQALAVMEHPNIAKVLDAGATDSGRPYFVMELVRGIPITRHCDEHQLTPAQRLALFIQVCHAIQHAHQKGIIHRDIKPSNILVTLHDDVAVPKVIDFGIAKATQGRLTDATVFTAFEQFIGTPAYMSPEQADFNALDVDTRSDVYSLGVLLYELLTGRPPFDPKTLAASGLDEIRRIIREVDPPRPSTLARTAGAALRRDSTAPSLPRGVKPLLQRTAIAEISSDLDWIVMKALEKNRTRRYESASAFAGDVQRFLGHEPVVARPPSRAYLLAKLVRRHRLAFAAAAVVVAALAIGAVVSTWQAVRATRAEREQSRLRATESDLRRQAEAQALAIRRRAYAGDMNLVQQALARDDLRRAQELLNRQRPAPGEPDLRGWEWRYLWQFCRDQSSWTLPLDAVAPRLSVSSDGHWIATAGGPTPGVWNLRTRQRWPIPRSAAGGAAVTAFSPTEPLLAISSWTAARPASARLTLWDMSRQEAVREWPLEHPFGGVVFCGDGRTLATMQGSDVVLWRVSTGERIASTTKFSAGQIAFSHDGRLAAREDVAGRVRLVDVVTGAVRWTVQAHADSAGTLAFSPDGTLLATAGSGVETAIRLWDVATGKEVGRLEGHQAYPRSIAFWPDGRTLASTGQDLTIRVWDLGTRKLKFSLRGHQRAVFDVALMPDQVTLVSTGGDATLRFWDTSPRSAGDANREPAPRVMRWAFTADSEAAITVDRAGQIRRWHGRDFQRHDEVGKVPAPITRGEPPDAKFVGLSADGRLVAVTSAQGIVQVWDWARGARVREIATSAASLLPVAFRDGDTKLLVNGASADLPQRGLFEWDLATGRATRSWLRRTPQAEYSVAADGSVGLVRTFGVPGGAVANTTTAANAGALSLIDFGTGVERPLAMGVAPLPLQGLFSPDGRLFAAPMGPTGTIFSTAPFEPVQTLTATMHGMSGGAFSPDGGRLAFTMSAFEAVRVWDTKNWEQVLTLDAPASRLGDSAFSPDGNVLGAMSYWGTLHFWRAPSWAEIEAAEKNASSP